MSIHLLPHRQSLASIHFPSHILWYQLSSHTGIHLPSLNLCSHLSNLFSHKHSTFFINDNSYSIMSIHSFDLIWINDSYLNDSLPPPKHSLLVHIRTNVLSFMDFTGMDPNAAFKRALFSSTAFKYTARPEPPTKRFRTTSSSESTSMKSILNNGNLLAGIYLHQLLFSLSVP